MMARGIILRRHDGLLTQRTRGLEASEREEACRRGQRQGGDAHAGREHKHIARTGSGLPGAVPAARRQKIAPMSTRMRQTDTTSNARTDLVVGRTPRAASTQITAQAGERERIPVGVVGQPGACSGRRARRWRHP